MTKPLIAINFKTYNSSTGQNCEHLAKVCDIVAAQEQASIIVCVSAPNIYKLSQALQIPVYAQHVDNITEGAHTGHILASDVALNGAAGTLLNHSERQMPSAELSEAFVHAKNAQLSTIICAATLEKAIEVAKLEPEYIAFEPPELIGGDISVTTRPEVITELVAKIRAISKTKILVGAGVKTTEDVRLALQLGCDGVLLASGITKSQDPEAALKGLIAGTR